MYLPPWFIIGSTRRGDYYGNWNRIPVFYWHISIEYKYFSRHCFLPLDFTIVVYYLLILRRQDGQCFGSCGRVCRKNPFPILWVSALAGDENVHWSNVEPVTIKMSRSFLAQQQQSVMLQKSGRKAYYWLHQLFDGIDYDNIWASTSDHNFLRQ